MSITDRRVIETCYRQSRESGLLFPQMLVNRLVRAVLSWKILLLSAKQVSIL